MNVEHFYQLLELSGCFFINKINYKLFNSNYNFVEYYG